MIKRYQKIAFTLAEVLVTLGIIGVVAAITLPVLISSYQKQVTVNKVKKFYTNMNQVLQMAKNDNGNIDSWNNSEDFYNIYVKPYIKNVQKDTTGVRIWGDFGSGLKFVFSDGTHAVISACKDLGLGNYITGSNVEVIFFTKSVGNNLRNYGANIKHPTRERFYFAISENGYLVPPHMSNSRDINKTNCKNSFHNGKYGDNGHSDCSTLIYKDGWKISDDYPW